MVTIEKEDKETGDIFKLCTGSSGEGHRLDFALPFTFFL